MTDIRELAPLWGEWQVEKPLGHGTFGTVYQVSREQLGHRTYAAVKHIQIPREDEEAPAFANQELTLYYDQEAATLQKEIIFMEELQGYANIVALQDSAILPRQDGPGYDVLLRMELLTSLKQRLREGLLPRAQVLRLGVDICRALMVLADLGKIHRDIKPANIFINSHGDYKLGDFGEARQLEKTALVSQRGTPFYMAPEIVKREPASQSADIYSLGLVLYELCNGNRVPFLPQGFYSKADESDAFARRLADEPLPPPLDADPTLAAVILKACAYTRAARYQSAAELKQALQSLIPHEQTVTPPTLDDKSYTVTQAPLPHKQTITLPTSDGKGYTVTVEAEQTELDLSGKGITDLSPLSGLFQLTVLNLTNNQIADLTPLSGLSQLTKLSLSENQIADLTPLSSLSQLTKLWLYSNQIADLTPLSGLSRLTDLQLPNNRIADLTPLSGLSQLTELILFGNQIVDLTPLSGLSQLTVLILFGNQIVDLTPLSGLSQLTKLSLHDNRIADLSPLSGLSQLTELDLNNNQITNLTPLSGLSQLTKLWLNNNQIADLTTLSGLSQLTVLALSNNQIADLPPLSGLPQLTKLSLDCNQITDLTPLSGLSQLTVLVLSGNPLRPAQRKTLQRKLHNCNILF